MLLLKYLLLFPPWLAANWQARDDTGGGGTSKSTLSITPAGTANFSGTVSYTAIMNGGGFASVRTSPPKLWNWSDYECGGLKLDVKGPILSLLEAPAR